MKVCLISDTHGKEVWLDLPEGDILIHCGDFQITNLNDLEYANRWFGRQNAKFKIFVPGNHDTGCEHFGKEMCKSLFTNVIYLQDEMVEIKGLRIYGSPFTPEFNRWSFMKERRSKELKEIWAKIPNNLDFLISHGPPYQILDKADSGEHCGCEILQREVFKKKPKYHCFGHIHGQYGQEIRHGVQFINCSLLNEDYKMVNKPVILEI